MRKAGAVLILALWSLAGPATAQDALTATAAATELKQMCEADAGQLWGVDLCGPLLVVDPATRAVWASDADRTGALTASGVGWTGVLPQGVAMANTTVEWAGQRWIMVMGPLPQSAQERRVLVAHEAWHRAQTAAGLAAQPSTNAHLETERGRYLMRMEFRALGTALRSNGRGRLSAVREALLFRITRLSEFPDAARDERALDRNEGLAAYTGVRLGVNENRDLYAARLLDNYDRHNALSRSYAYATGPAYGVLLDDRMPEWRRQLRGYAPADLLAYAVGARFDAGDLRRAMERYNGQAVAAEERARAEAERFRIAELQARFGQGPRLELPLQSMQIEFDPDAVTPVAGLGNFYGTLTLRDAWGEITASQGALISADFTRLTAAAPAPDGLSGPGWRLRLEPGYQLVGPDLQGVVRLAYLPLQEPDSAPPT
jgi:hypothetical protein